MTVLVVRPSPACEELVAQLNLLGVKALPAPLLSFNPGDDLPSLSQTLCDLPSGSVVIAISPRSIEYAAGALATNNQSWRDDLHYVAVGAKTASVWKSLTNIEAIQPPTEDSEGMLTLPLFGNAKGLSVLILRGNGGRALLGNTLAKNGAQVRYFEAYQRHWDDKHLSSQIEQWHKASVDTVVFTSGEQLALMYQSFSSHDQQWLRECHILVPSKRIYNQAIELGFNAISCVSSPSNTTLLHALCEMNNSG
ncbi:uroporphyrinogen-III synthase [Enterovibrio nigricans]|uniref:Uroporphyrinogen-III synthase n=1 Tax=Enterovibrio nigricans DSM 22720 TaxID=1121868 RepID=A0A1T4U9T3_9GAMM|nr:uroporphyrinogen-III synthase [Enterovibrio nigricans]PKF51365.1 uroporphyrinogen-III synthase [Enterovibrio nigricans]SKA49419.1 uroporphyrinogen-III synthase [Enterovibrio nigricans DSM 22720]